MDFPGFPTLGSSGGATQKLPLTARATVTETSSSGAASTAVPAKVATTSSNLEHRNKGDPLLTRLLYGMLAWISNVPLEKGYSQVDWMRVMRSKPAPALRRDITMAEVKQHKTREDAWMVFRNRVYDISPYLRFHPGGADILFKAAGKDGTSLFMKYHPWVNIDALMEKCLVGLLAEAEVVPAAAAPAPAPVGAAASAVGTAATAVGTATATAGVLAAAAAVGAAVTAGAVGDKGAAAVGGGKADGKADGVVDGGLLAVVGAGVVEPLSDGGAVVAALGVQSAAAAAVQQGAGAEGQEQQPAVGQAERAGGVAAATAAPAGAAVPGEKGRQAEEVLQEGSEAAAGSSSSELKQ